jgi:NitT/TauT family transport system substrate-binding protein
VIGLLRFTQMKGRVTVFHTQKFAALAFGCTLLASASALAADPSVVVKIAVIGSGGQAEVPYVIKTFGLDKKYGLDVEQVDYSMPGQHYAMFRSGAADIAPGNFMDLLRQRKAGLKIRAFHGFQGYNNIIVAKPSSAIATFADLKGKKVGEFGTTFLDWLILRAAGEKAYGFDLEKDSTIVQGAPPLLNQLLARNEVDATLQFSSLTFGPLARGEQKVVADLPAVMRAAGFSPEAFYLQWLVTEDWIKAHPDAVGKLDAMFAEAYVRLQSDDSVWPPLAKMIGITDPAAIEAYRDKARKIDNPPFNAGLIKPTQTLLDALVALAGEQATGVTVIDPAAFLFPEPKAK